MFLNDINIPVNWDTGTGNIWDYVNTENYWTGYNGVDIKEKDRIGDGANNVLLNGSSAKDQFPLIYHIYLDLNGDGLDNLEEYSVRGDNYRTNVSAIDSDSDGVDDYSEFGNATITWNPDTDSDNLGDLEEITLGADGYVTNAANPDTDSIMRCSYCLGAGGALLLFDLTRMSSSGYGAGCS